MTARTFPGGWPWAFLLGFSRNVLYTTSIGNLNDMAIRLGDPLDPHHPRSSWATAPARSHLRFCATAVAPSASEDTTLRLWDLETCTSRRVRREATGLGSVAFSPEGRRAAYVCGASIHLCDLETGDELMSFEALPDGISKVAFSVDGRQILSYGGDIRIWDVETGKEVRRIGDAQSCWIMALLPDGRRALTRGEWGFDVPIVVRDLETGRQTRRIPVKYSTAIAVSHDGRRALFGVGMTVWLWDIENWEEIDRFEGHRGDVVHVALSFDGSRGVSTSTDRTVRVWALPPGRPKGERPAVAETAQYLDDAMVFPQLAVVSPDGRHVLATASKTDMCFWDGETPQGGGANVPPSPAAATTMYLWDRESGRLIRRFGESARLTMSVAFSPDGKTASVAAWTAWCGSGTSSRATRFANSAGTPNRSFPSRSRPTDAWPTPRAGGGYANGRWHDGTDSAVRVWDVATGQQVGKLEGHKGIVWGAVVSPDGHRVLTCGRDKNVFLWDAGTGREIRRLLGHTASVGCVAFLLDGRRAVSSGLDRTIRLWDLESGREIQTFRGSSEALAWVAVSPDGTRTLSADLMGQELRLWDLESRGPVRRIKLGNTTPTRGSFTSDGRHAVWAAMDGVVRMFQLSVH